MNFCMGSVLLHVWKKNFGGTNTNLSLSNYSPPHFVEFKKNQNLFYGGSKNILTYFKQIFIFLGHPILGQGVK